LIAARTYAGRTGNIEVALRCYHLAVEIARHEKDFDAAVAEAEAGIQLADSCGFGRWSIDIRLELSRVYLATDALAASVEMAAQALKMSNRLDCQYAWGVAESLHLLGIAHSQLGDVTKARDYLQRAVEERPSLEHRSRERDDRELHSLDG
jgi:tetratricopeptide (TPR) repeat protein